MFFLRCGPTRGGGRRVFRTRRGRDPGRGAKEAVVRSVCEICRVVLVSRYALVDYAEFLVYPGDELGAKERVDEFSPGSHGTSPGTKGAAEEVSPIVVERYAVKGACDGLQRSERDA